jgi:RHS repeat-associated protein
MWLSEAGAYHYKARAYSPTFGGRFLQADPIGYAGGINLYAYVRNDPINFIDPLGLCERPGQRGYCVVPVNPNYGPANDSTIVVTGDLCRVRDCGRLDPWVEIKLADNSLHAAGNNGERAERAGGASTNLAPKKPPRTNRRYNPKRNYCGGEGGVGLPNAIGGTSINDLCYSHDLCYDQSGISKLACDQQFAQGILSRVGLYIMWPDLSTRFLGSFFISLTGYTIVWIGGVQYYVPE